MTSYIGTPFVSFVLIITTTRLHGTHVIQQATVTSFPVFRQQTPDFRRVAQPRDPLPYYVVEELPVSTPIGSVPIDAMLDRTHTEDQLKELRYAIGSQTTADRGERVDLFTVDVTSGVVSISSQIDRDVLCHDRAMCFVQLDVIISPTKYFRIIRIAIEILDINDNSPVFGLEEFKLRLPETVLVGSSYVLPVAVDIDSEHFGVRGYQLFPESDANVEKSRRLLPFKLVYDSR